MMGDESPLHSLIERVEEAISSTYEVALPELRSLAQTPSPPELFHYTNDGGLYGILRNGTLRLSDVFQQNDPSEIEYGFQLFSSLGAEYLDDNPSLSYLVDDGLRVLFNEWGFRDDLNYFCTCFSAHRNDLSQWRSYGDDGKGFCLVFEAAPLVNAFNQREGQTTKQVFRICYDEDKIKKAFLHIWNSILPIWTEADQLLVDGEARRSFRNRIVRSLFPVILSWATYFKHPAYSAEQEVRFHQDLHSFHSPEVKTALRHYSISRFFDFQWKANASRSLKEIIIGPDAGKYTEKFVRDLFREYDWNCHISHSDIPYRSF